MKTSAVVAAALFSTFAFAAPLEKRAYATKTEVHIEYYTVYTTVTGAPPAPTSDPALFYEGKPSTMTTVTTPKAKNPPPPPPAAPPVPTTEAPPPPKPTTAEKPQPEPVTTPAYTPPPPVNPAPSEEPKPSTQAPPPPPPPASTQPAAPQNTQPSQSSNGDGEVHTGGSLTLNYYNGGMGACGFPVDDSTMVVALASDLMGPATYDPATGNPTNKWCNKKVKITNGDKTATAVIGDRCEGCTNGGFDCTPALWEALTGGLGGASGDRIYSMSWEVVG